MSVYNLSAIADAAPIRALSPVPVPQAQIDAVGLGCDMRRRLDTGMKAAASNPMIVATGSGGSDYVARQLGYTPPPNSTSI